MYSQSKPFSKEFENYSFVSKFSPDDRMHRFMVDSSRNKTESSPTPTSNKPYSYNPHKRLYTLHNHLNTIAKESNMSPLYSLGIDGLPRMEERAHNPSQQSISTRSRDPDLETYMTFGDESGLESLATDRYRLASESNRNEPIGLSYRVRYPTNPTNPETIESPRRVPQSARVRSRKNELSTSLQGQEQIQKFKNLLNQHPEPHPYAPDISPEQKLRPKSQQAVVRSYNLDAKVNFEWKPVLGDRRYQDISPEKTSTSGFYGNAGQELFPMKPMLHRKRSSQNRDSSPIGFNYLFANPPAKVSVLPPQRILKEKSTTRVVKRNNVKPPFEAISERPKSHENHRRRAYFDQVQNKENNSFRLTNGHNGNDYYFFGRKSNFPISQETRKLLKAIEPSPPKEKSYREISSGRISNNLPIMDSAAVRQPLSNQTNQRVATDESKDSGEAPASNKISFRTKFRVKACQKGNFKQTFGVLDSLEAELIPLNKKNANYGQHQGNENIKPPEHKTPKFKADHFSIFRNSNKTLRNDSPEPQPIEEEILTEITENTSIDDKLITESSAPYHRGKKLVPTGIQISSINTKPTSY